MRHMITATFRAAAVIDFPDPLLFFIASYRSINRQLSVLFFSRLIPSTTWMIAVLSSSGPRFVIFPYRTISFEFCTHGTSPQYAANFFPLENRLMSSIYARIVAEHIAPHPGIVFSSAAARSSSTSFWRELSIQGIGVYSANKA
jgi:hypothetical protein